MRDIKHKDIAEATGLNPATLSRWKNGSAGKRRQILYYFLIKNGDKYLDFVDENLGENDE